MMSRIKYIAFFVTLLIFAHSGNAQEIKGYKLSLERDSIIIGDQIKLSVNAENNPKYLVSFPKIKDTIVPGVELVKDLGIDTIKINGEIKEFKKNYLITSFDSGRYRIMFPIIVKKSDKETDTISSNVVDLYVNTLPIDTLTYKMFDIKPVIKYPLTIGEIIPWILCAVIFIALCIIGFILYRRWKNKQPLFGKSKPKIPPYVLACKELSALKTEKLWQQGKVKAYYTRITDIIRVYIEDRFFISTMEKTSDEILNDIKKEKIDEMYSFDKMREMFYTADLVKFAKYQPTANENETTFSTAFEFVINTKPEIIDEENSGQTNNNADNELKNKEEDSENV